MSAASTQSSSGQPSPQPRPLRVAVIGGGISGLAAAFRLGELSQQTGRSIETTLFEADERLGGVIETRHINGYVVELGSDSFITAKPWAVELCCRLGLEDQLEQTDPAYRRTFVLRAGRPVDVPEGFMLLTPTKIGAVLGSPLFSPLGKLRMGLEYFIPARKGQADESLASFVRRRFGREVFDRLVQPLIGGIYTADPEKLSLQATMPRFIEMERQHGSLLRAARRQHTPRPNTAAPADSGARYSMFLTLRGGMCQLIDRLVEKITAGQARIRLAMAVEAIRPVAPSTQLGSQRDWEVTLADGYPECFDAAILALRAYQAAALVRGFDPALANALESVEYASSVIVVSGHRLEDIAHPLDASGLVVPQIEGREILSVSISSRKFPGRAPAGRVLLRTFLGGALNPRMIDRSDEELIAHTRSELAGMLGAKGDPEFALVARYRRAMPQYHVGHLDRTAEIDRLRAPHAGLFLAGNAYEGVGIPDCIHRGEQAAENILESNP